MYQGKLIYVLSQAPFYTHACHICTKPSSNTTCYYVFNIFNLRIVHINYCTKTFGWNFCLKYILCPKSIFTPNYTIHPKLLFIIHIHLYHKLAWFLKMYTFLTVRIDATCLHIFTHFNGSDHIPFFFTCLPLNYLVSPPKKLGYFWKTLMLHTLQHSFYSLPHTLTRTHSPVALIHLHL